MIKVAATPADVRKRKIIQAVQDMNFAADPYAQHFGISVDTKMAQVKGNEKAFYCYNFVFKKCIQLLNSLKVVSCLRRSSFMDKMKRLPLCQEMEFGI